MQLQSLETAHSGVRCCEPKGLWKRCLQVKIKFLNCKISQAENRTQEVSFLFCSAQSDDSFPWHPLQEKQATSQVSFPYSPTASENPLSDSTAKTKRFSLLPIWKLPQTLRGGSQSNPKPSVMVASFLFLYLQNPLLIALTCQVSFPIEDRLQSQDFLIVDKGRVYGNKLKTSWQILKTDFNF